MKRFFVIATSSILVITIISLIIIGLGISNVNNSIDYALDEELFAKAKEDNTVYYYAYNSFGELEEIYKSSKNNIREWTNFRDVGENLKHGFLAMEDRRFYSHKGVNYRRTFLAVINHIFKIGNSFGASTITQQVIKNISGDNEASISRKVKEILRAYNLEKNHSKDDIFELYLNIIPMSGNVYGIGAAADIYFGKEPYELSLSEAATLVGITNAPSKYNPYKSPDACVEKRNKVLFAMYDCGYITEEDYKEAKEQPLVLNNGDGNYGISSWFVETANEEILKDMQEKYSLSYAASKLMLNGSRVLLTVNTEIQSILEDYFYNEENLSEKVTQGLNYSMVISDPNTGDLLGVIGNGGRKKGNLLLNYALTPVKPGSSLKPLALFAPLIDKGIITWSSIFDDSPYKYVGDGVPYPKNSPDVYEGPIDINDALKRSKNTVAIRLLELIGKENAFYNLKNTFGFDTLVDGVKTDKGTISDIGESPLALGQLSYGVPLRRLTEAYNVFSNHGELCEGRSYTAVYDKAGNKILSKEISSKKVYSVETAQIMNQMLSNVVLDGTARLIRLKELIDVAGKTGTSGNDRDRLFIGYTPYFTAGIWTGYGKEDKEVGYNNPNHLQIWDSIMTQIHERLILKGYDETVKSFETNRLVVAPYCSVSGKSPTEQCELDDGAIIKFGYFAPQNLNEELCEYH